MAGSAAGNHDEADRPRPLAHVRLRDDAVGVSKLLLPVLVQPARTPKHLSRGLDMSPSRLDVAAALRNDLRDRVRSTCAISNKSLISHHTTTPAWAAPFLRVRAVALPPTQTTLS